MTTPLRYEKSPNPRETNRYFISRADAPSPITDGRDFVGDAYNEDAARLFAAAPELLAALKELIQTCPADNDTTEGFYQANVMAQAAIAKAEGGAQ